MGEKGRIRSTKAAKGNVLGGRTPDEEHAETWVAKKKERPGPNRIEIVNSSEPSGQEGKKQEKKAKRNRDITMARRGANTLQGKLGQT